MRFCHYQECLSPHMTPLMRSLVKRLGEDEVRYVYMRDIEAGRRSLGWVDMQNPRWTLDARRDPEKARMWLEDCPCLMSGCRDFELFERRTRRGLLTFYSGERWFKPLSVFRGHLDLPGYLRLFSPQFFRMASRMRRLLCGKVPFYYLPDGVLAARDLIWLMDWQKGNVRPLNIECARVPGGKVMNRGKEVKTIRLWGYFVEPSTRQELYSQPQTGVPPLKVLWVGRLLELKRVDVIIRALLEHDKLNRGNGDLSDITVDVYGDGPMERPLRDLAAGHGDIIRFHSSVSIDSVRHLMQEHDIYVLTSNANEGWGAVVSEALEEGMRVLGTYEAGASATMLTGEDLFHAGDWRRLQTLLERCLDEKRRGVLKGQGIGEWSVEKAADRLLALINEVQGSKS